MTLWQALWLYGTNLYSIPPWVGYINMANSEAVNYSLTLKVLVTTTDALEHF